ncbi:DMT family transporter [Pelagibacterium sediminicola]|uniref:DMT family transporter n=1 Tax=Pelagibacterium sediminicola TaxID=2248761 RepID=UPI001FE76DF6|nr:DMT family transporter [Pelagibacterium sediminicola]
MTEIRSSILHATGTEKLRGHLAMVCFAALIAGSFTLAPLALPHIDSVSLNVVRYIVAVAAMAGWMFGIQRKRFAWPSAPWRYLVLGGLMAIYFVTMFIALTMTSPVSTSAVFTLTPLMTVGFGLLLAGQTFGPILLLSLAVAACGSVWMIFGGSVETLLDFKIGQGEIIFFFGCVAHALYAPLLRRLNRGDPQALATFYILVGTALCLTLYGLPQIVTIDWLALPPVVWAVVFYLAIATGIISFALIQYASMRLPAAKVMSYSYLVPAYVIVYEGISGHGWASPSVALGALVTGLGLVVLYFAPDK